MIKVANLFVDVLRKNDILKAKSMLMYDTLQITNESFAYNVNKASEVINKYGIPQNEKLYLKKDIHNVQETFGIAFPIFSAKNEKEELQNAEIVVFLQKESNEYKVLFFENDFEYKMSPIEP